MDKYVSLVPIHHWEQLLLLLKEVEVTLHTLIEFLHYLFLAVLLYRVNYESINDYLGIAVLVISYFLV